MRLISFGCSHTQGLGIIKETYDLPCDSSWSGQLSKMLNLYHINNGKSAASNVEIHNRIRNFKFNKDDIVVVMFTYFTRGIVFRQYEDNVRVIPYFDVPINILKEKNYDDIEYHKKIGSIRKNYYELHNEFDMIKSNFIAIHNIYNELQNKNLRYFCRFVESLDEYKLHSSHNKKSVSDDSYHALLNESWNFQFVNDIKKTSLRALGYDVDENLRYGFDNMHWSYQVHTKMAQEYYNEITNMV